MYKPTSPLDPPFTASSLLWTITRDGKCFGNFGWGRGSKSIDMLLDLVSQRFTIRTYRNQLDKIGSSFTIRGVVTITTHPLKVHSGSQHALRPYGSLHLQLILWWSLCDQFRLKNESCVSSLCRSREPRCNLLLSAQELERHGHQVSGEMI